MHDSSYKEKVLLYMHTNPRVGHAGFLKTYQRAKADFYWREIKKDIEKMVREWDNCQVYKAENIFPAGLQPLSISFKAWADTTISRE